MSKLLDLITLVDNVPLDFATNHYPYYRLFLSPSDPRPHGYIHPTTLSRMAWPSDGGGVTVSETDRTVTLAEPPPGVSAAEHINSTLQHVVDDAIANDTFPILNGMHSEPFRLPGARVRPDGGGGGDESPPAQVERFAGSLFGIATRGAHMTCYTRRGDGDRAELKVWVARRSRSLFAHPGKLDSTVAGGVKAADSPWDCILAESLEEVSLRPEAVREAARPAGVVTLANRNAGSGLFHAEILYVYDMDMDVLTGSREDGRAGGQAGGDESGSKSPAVRPELGYDGEVEALELMGLDEIRTRMEAGEFKPNVCAVMIDFMIRHGHVTPETEGEEAYLAICSRLRRNLPMAVGPLGL
ncbi:NUDIX domain [Geosmithia morbida]|uniref:NUDIX domain n=1 Tax=Geosmithia morbida TaxID=1094350 RepID=A0A9P4YUL0_9HYPO|nr:NUDIX domain [Geosmithia morbida]KAF4121978.1 NUDIX domain [Geosmithia morbida]